MSQTPPISFSARSGLDVSSERRTVRYVVGSTEFFALDRARLHAWSLALDGHSVQIAKVVYDTLQSPKAPMGSAIVETWDERSAFVLLNSAIKPSRPRAPPGTSGPRSCS